jgi:hypothetical protein
VKLTGYPQNSASQPAWRAVELGFGEAIGGKVLVGCTATSKQFRPAQSILCCRVCNARQKPVKGTANGPRRYLWGGCGARRDEGKCAYRHLRRCSVTSGRSKFLSGAVAEFAPPPPLGQPVPSLRPRRWPPSASPVRCRTASTGRTSGTAGWLRRAVVIPEGVDAAVFPHLSPGRPPKPCPRW